MSEAISNMHERLLNRADIRKLIPVSDMTIWRWRQAHSFPEPIIIHSRCYWRKSDVANWLASQAQPEET